MVIISIIALTVGASGLTFGLVRGVLLQPLPYGQPEKLVALWEENPHQGYLRNTVAMPNFEDWHREAVDSFKFLAAWKHQEDVLIDRGEPERLVGATVTSDFFSVLGVKPLLGRTFSLEEERQKAGVVLISEDLWRRRFGAARGIVGKSVLLNGNPFTIIGVMPGNFDQPLKTILNKSDFWRPMVVNPPRGTRFLIVLGRLSGDLAMAKSTLKGVSRLLATHYPEDEGWTVDVIPLQEELVRTVRPVLQILFIAANLVLLIGCTNLANILLARAASRENEIALRLSLGASRWRLFSLFATESLAFVLPGSLLGALLAWSGGRLLVRNYLQFLPRADEIDLGGPVFWFSLLLAVLITLATAVIILKQVSRLDLGKSISEMGRRAGTDRRTRRMRESLAVLQVVLTFPLLVSAILLVESMQRLEKVDLGFTPQSVVAGDVALPSRRYGDPKSQSKFFHALLDGLNSTPGIVAHSAISDLPLSPWNTGTEFVPVGMQIGPGEKKPFAQYRIIAPDYFRTMSIQRVNGRDFSDQDGNDTEAVLIVNKQLAQRFFHGRDPVGERLSINSSGEPLEGRIVGVVSDVRHGGPTDDLEPTIYVPYLQSPTPRMTILIRCPNGSEAVAYALRHGVQTLDRGLPAPEVRNLETLYSDAMAAPRLRALVLGLLGVLALSLAALGIYGAVAYSTAIRRHEIGVRMALGAQRREILLMVLRYGAGLCAWGVLGGVVLGFAASRLLANYLYGVSVMDITAWVVIAGLLIGIGVMASLRPATSAVYLEPIGALKSE